MNATTDGGKIDPLLREKILKVLDTHRICTVATLRPDGWPQATTVGYVHVGLAIYFLCALDSQKAANIARDDRVSLTIDHDTADIMAISALSLAGHAHTVEDRAEAERVITAMIAAYADAPAPVPIVRPSPDDIRIFRVTPSVISLLDYSKGFGHTDLVRL
uniref:pyridoxamine 5'-phosphate oxidase family protein n=1 Tax=Ancylobacter mangrovi TaxID=2972472 RepID=UPI002867E6CD|nr:pyridoxamine 5'-phosphate oxidase family protein [Ancylobacter mangrovi]